MAWAFMATPRPEPSLRARAMRFLARREHSRAELERKLAPKVAEGEDVDAVLDDLAQRGWLSDARFAEQSARAKARRFGPLKLAHYLRARGVGDEAIAAGVRDAGVDGVANLEAIWQSRFRARARRRAREGAPGALPAGPRLRARRHLQVPEDSREKP